MIMPRKRKGDILGEIWEYTIFSDEFSEIDEDAVGLNPPAGTMMWKGYSYPEIAFSFTPKLHDNGLNGPWWLPDDYLWQRDDLLLSILSKAVMLETIPVIKDYLLLNSSVEIIRQNTLFVPIHNGSLDEDLVRNLRQKMTYLVTCELAEKEDRYTEIVRLLSYHYKKDDQSFRIRFCLVKFSHRIWIEGIYHTRIHPIIVIPTNVYGRYHSDD